MAQAHRARIGPEGSLLLPREVLKATGWKEGTHVEVTAEKEVVVLRRIEVDPFEEARRKPDENAFDRILAEQKESAAEARRAFEEKVRKGEVPERRPEDSPDYWR